MKINEAREPKGVKTSDVYCGYHTCSMLYLLHKHKIKKIIPILFLYSLYGGKGEYDMRKLILVFLLSGPWGCASMHTTLTNQAGQKANCDNVGFGVIGSLATVAMHNDCVDKYKALGYTENGQPPAPSNANTQVISTTPTTLSSKNGSFKITLPAGWVQAEPPPKVSCQLFAKNPTLDTYLLMNSINSTDVTDWQVYAESLKAKLMGNLNQSTASEVRKIKVNDFDALQSEIAGNLKNGLRIRYLGTCIKTDKQLIWMVSWCVESQYAANRAGFESLPSGLQ